MWQSFGSLWNGGHFFERWENERQGAPVSAEVKGTSGTDYHSYVTSTENGRLRHRGGGPVAAVLDSPADVVEGEIPSKAIRGTLEVGGTG